MKLSILFFALVSMSTAFARADVNLRNGNFYVTFRDLAYPGGELETKIERVYNSKTNFIGMFGLSWGIEYETRLRVDPDGSIIISSYGGGADNRFVAKNYNAKDLTAGVELLIQTEKKAGILTSEKQVQAERTKLTNEFDYRADRYAMFVNKGTLPRKAIAEGTQFTSTEFLYQYVTRVKGGFVHVMEGKNIQKFNEMGKLVQIMDRNKNFINFTYDKNNHMVQIVDSQNRKLNLTWNQMNFVEKITGESGKFATYKYDAKGYLIYARDDSGFENTYSYTNDIYKYLNEIGYLQNKDSKGKPKKMQINYYGADLKTNVKSVLNPDGTVNEYEYIKNPKDPSYYGVHVLLKDSDGSRISDSKYEYFSKIKLGGVAATMKMISTIDGDRTETVYDEKNGFPVKVTNNGRVTTMAYDIKGRMTKKVTPLETTDLTYDPVVGKVSRVQRKLKSGTVLWSSFQYDPPTGNLVFAKNNENKSVKLIYDTNGRIRALVDQSQRQLTFKYNELSKPIEISDAKVGTVKFTYKNSGEVDKVESNGGAAVSTEVMKALQSLIDITAPSGVTMGI